MRQAPASIEAAEFVLKGSDGKTPARLALNPDGGVFFVLFDAGGIPRSELSVASDGTSLFALAAADRKTRVISRVRSDGLSGNFVYDAAGRDRLEHAGRQMRPQPWDVAAHPARPPDPPPPPLSPPPLNPPPSPSVAGHLDHGLPKLAQKFACRERHPSLDPELK